MANDQHPTPEHQRLVENSRRERNWERWGPYLSERQWGTVREDYSASGDCWSYFPHDVSRSRAYRWGEDGLLGWCDRECRLCFSVALWNGRDPILKERLFGLNNHEGNHGEDVKELYYYLDSTPTHSYARALYKYPQAAFPYDWLVNENRRRGLDDPEFELEHTGVFNENRYFDVTAEYAKASPDDLLIRLTVANRGPDESTLHLLPTVWFRNTWAWGAPPGVDWGHPRLRKTGDASLRIEHASLGTFVFDVQGVKGQPAPELLFTENETNTERLYGQPNDPPFVKDAFHRRVIHDEADAVSPAGEGSKAAAWLRLTVPAGKQAVVCCRLRPEAEAKTKPFARAFADTIKKRKAEADAFYDRVIPAKAEPAERDVIRQAYAGLLWSRQFYEYILNQWQDGDPLQPPPPPGHATSRNTDWRHFYSRDVLSMPDKWEYPWFAAWDSAFHMVAMAEVDPDYAKSQLLLFLREWYMHANGELPAYEFQLDDVNPPVHAWACWRVYKIAGKWGKRDRTFLERAFLKLLLNFTWWVNRKDPDGNNLFAGGFLGLDNIGVFDRNKPLPGGESLLQADGTAWMAFYATTMLAMAFELAQDDPAYEDIASKFFEHFIAISDAMNFLGGTGLWDERDGFYYDHLASDGWRCSLRLRSMVGIIPLFAVEALHSAQIDKLPGFKKRMEWFLANRKDLSQTISYMERGTPPGMEEHRLLAIPSRRRLERVLAVLLDESRLLSPYGVRSLSREYADAPYKIDFDGQHHEVHYAPGDSRTVDFGGNSNWRGPVWYPLNYLLIEALQRYGHFYGDSLKVECPTGSGNHLTLDEVATELARRLGSVFLPDAEGRRPVFAGDDRYADDPHFKDLVLFYECFHGDTGRGIGASHQTGWTALVTRCLADACAMKKDATGAACDDKESK